MSEAETPVSALDRALGLSRLIVEEWPALRADFQRFYGMDLADAVAGGPDGHGIGLRDLGDLIGGLPQESALAASQGWHWTTLDELMALTVEITHQGTWASFQTMGASFASAGIKTRPKPPKPLRIPRPGEPDKQKSKSPETVADVISMFAAAGALDARR